MGKQENLENEQQPVGPTATLESVLIPTPDLAEELRRENEQLKKQLSDKDRYITDLSSDKSTLEERLTQTQPKQNVNVNDNTVQNYSRILEMAQVDPQKAGEELANLVNSATTKAQQDVIQNLEPVISRNVLVSKVKIENADLIDLGLEPAISNRTAQLMSSGKSFEKALETAVSEAREKVNKLKSNTPKSIEPAPVSVVSESGSNFVPISAPVKKEETEQDEIDAERNRRRKLGL